MNSPETLDFRLPQTNDQPVDKWRNKTKICLYHEFLLSIQWQKASEIDELTLFNSRVGEARNG